MSIKPRSAKNKGRKLQKFVCEEIASLLGVKCEKDGLVSPRPMGQSGPDIILIGEAREKLPISFECKWQEKWNVHEFIKQAMEQMYPGTTWAVVMKKNRQKLPYVIIPWEFFMELLSKYMGEDDS